MRVIVKETPHKILSWYQEYGGQEFEVKKIIPSLRKDNYSYQLIDCKHNRDILNNYSTYWTFNREDVIISRKQKLERILKN